MGEIWGYWMDSALNHLLPRNLQSMCSPLCWLMSRHTPALSCYYVGARSHQHTSGCYSLLMLNRQLSNVASKQKTKQTNKQIRQTDKTISMSSSHIVLELAPILNTFVCVWWVRSIPYSVGARSHNALCSHFFYCHFGSVSFDLAVWFSIACGRRISILP